MINKIRKGTKVRRVRGFGDTPFEKQLEARGNVRKAAEEIHNYLSGMNHDNDNIVYKYSFGQELPLYKKKEILYNENYNRKLYEFNKRGWLKDLLSNNWTLIRVTDESTLTNLQTLFYFKDYLEPYYFDPKNLKRKLNDWERNSGDFPKFFTLKSHAKNKKAYDKEDYSEEFFDYIINGPTKETSFDEAVHNYMFIHKNDIGFFENYVKNLLEDYYISDHNPRRFKPDETEVYRSNKEKQKQNHLGHDYRDIAHD